MITVRRARRQSALANDERILDAAVLVANDVGLDRLTVSSVAKEAGFTSGATYARCGDREELLVALWERRAADALEQLIRQVGSFRRRGATAAYRTAIVEAVANPSPALRIAIETCLIAHRVDELFDIVPRTVKEWLADLQLDREQLSPDESVDLAFIAGALGYVALHPFPDPLAADLDTALRWTAGPASAPVGDPLPPISTAQELVMEPDDLINDILRRAQMSNSQVKHRLDYLMGDAAMASALHAYLQPEALVRRRMHNETVVAAWHHPHIAAVYSAAEWKAIEDVADEFPEGITSRERIVDIQRAALMAIHGSAVLREVLREIAHLDCRPAASLLVTAALTDH